jgi:magnesium transporter
MTELSRNLHYTESIEETLQHVHNMLEGKVLKSAKAKVNGEPHFNQVLNDLKTKIELLHLSDIAFLLEALPINRRLTVWNCISPQREGKILIKLPDAVRETLIAEMTHDELCIAAKQLNTNEIADLAPSLPQAVMREVFKSLAIEKREQLRSAMSYSNDAVGSLMDFNMVTIRKDATIEAVLRFLRRLDELPEYTDQLFVVDRDEMFIGALPLNTLLVNEPEVKIVDLMNTDSFTLRPEDKVQQFANELEHYVFVSVPVIDDDGKLLGRVPINTMVNFISTKSEKILLNHSGLLVHEDIFASVLNSEKNRWIWLLLNLCIAFIASRIIGNFEETIAEFVSLAALIPIVIIFTNCAAYQTSAIIIRSLGSGFINKRNANRLLTKEITISLFNGVVWGGLASVFVYLIYKNLLLCIVLFGALLINQLIGGLVGLLIPLALHKQGRNTADFFSHILITTINTTASLYILFELATIFLMH